MRNKTKRGLNASGMAVINREPKVKQSFFNLTFLLTMLGCSSLGVVIGFLICLAS